MICTDTGRPCRINGCGDGQCYRRNYNEKPDEKQQGHAPLAGVVEQLDCPECSSKNVKTHHECDDCCHVWDA